jgi:hypothetical protein
MQPAKASRCCSFVADTGVVVVVPVEGGPDVAGCVVVAGILAVGIGTVVVVVVDEVVVVVDEVADRASPGADDVPQAATTIASRGSTVAAAPTCPGRHLRRRPPVGCGVSWSIF